jgi:ribosomal protein S12 methylthiotransferase
MIEAENLLKAGVKELLVISQDTSAYGVDLKYAESQWRGRDVKAKFLDLSRELGDLAQEHGAWVRMHYVYPYPHVDDVLPLMAEGKILPYLDIPFQHASPRVLKAMRRPAHQEQTLERLKAWRKAVPDLTLRSTFIVGFPGETEDDFNMMLDWLDEAELDRVGCFKYEPVEGAKANELADPVDEDEKQDRWERFMEHQRTISERRMAAKVGRTLDVLIDEGAEEDEESGELFAIGRSAADAPEIDGNVFITGAGTETLQPGQIVQVKIEAAEDYDLSGSLARK